MLAKRAVIAGVVAAALAAAGLAVAAGGAGAVGATVGNGGAYGWGDNGAGQTGTGSADSVVQTPQPIPSLPGRVRQVAPGFAVLTDGTVWTLGGGTPAAVPGLTGITQLATSHGSVLALGAGGTLWVWGGNRSGQLGDGGTADRPVPFQVPGLRGLTQVAVGTDTGMALRSDGTVLTWGTGYLGDGTHYTQPRNPGAVPHLTGVTQIAAGGFHSMVVRSDGTLWTWGVNSTGQLGVGSQTDQGVPVQVPGLTNVTSIAGGALYSLAVADPNASVWSWGANFAQDFFDPPMGQLGDGTQVHQRLSPVRLALTGIVQVAAGSSAIWASSAAIDRVGRLWTWGNNDWSQLGVGGRGVIQFAPVRVPTIPWVQQISIDLTTLAVVANVSVRSPGTKTGQVGIRIPSFTITASPAATYTWSVSGLPPGLRIDPATGFISGVPTKAGAYGVIVTASSANGSGQMVFTYTIT